MILGLIGGVGSGKSTVTAILEKKGFQILHTDDIAKELELPGRPVYLSLAAEFGDRILEDAGEGQESRPIDKRKMAALIYSDPQVLKKVNELVHPAVWHFVDEEIERAGKAVQDAGPEAVRIAVETALPNEHFREICDEIWFIYTQPETRIRRLMESRGYTREKCESIIAGQHSDEEFMLIADYTIDNSGSPAETEERIRELTE